MSSLIDALRAIIRDELAARRPPELGIVTQVYPGDGNAGNDQADLRLRGSGLELARVPVAAFMMPISIRPKPPRSTPPSSRQTIRTARSSASTSRHRAAAS